MARSSFRPHSVAGRLRTTRERLAKDGVAFDESQSATTQRKGEFALELIVAVRDHLDEIALMIFTATALTPEDYARLVGGADIGP